MAGVCSAFRSNAGRTEVEDEGQVAAATELAFVCLGLQVGEHLQVDGNARDLNDAADALLFSAGQLELALSSQVAGLPWTLPRGQTSWCLVLVVSAACVFEGGNGGHTWCDRRESCVGMRRQSWNSWRWVQRLLFSSDDEARPPWHENIFLGPSALPVASHNAPVDKAHPANRQGP